MYKADLPGQAEQSLVLGDNENMVPKDIQENQILTAPRLKNTIRKKLHH